MEHYLHALDAINAESHQTGGRAPVPNGPHSPAGQIRRIFEEHNPPPKAGMAFEQGAVRPSAPPVPLKPPAQFVERPPPAPRLGIRWMMPSNKHLFYGAIAISISAVVIGLVSYLVSDRGATVASGVSAAKQATPQLDGDMVDIPLPSRRPPWKSSLRAGG
ncbi:MAG: hypothetical protein WBX25_21855 [Rhodomicrobium sp.]